jgi:redox-sensitive bicupin YhaK (pirin superfamily)
LIGNDKLTILAMLLFLNIFQSEKPQEYMDGFYSNSLSGFETITQMLAGNIRHKDNIW